jgi:hypothetical protein
MYVCSAVGSVAHRASFMSGPRLVLTGCRAPFVQVRTGDGNDMKRGRLEFFAPEGVDNGARASE